MRSHWDDPGNQPTIQEMLDDPIVKLLMARDRIGPARVREAVETARRRQMTTAPESQPLRAA